ncbi:amidohydrolase [Paraglaciecola polaris]|uniref:Thermostable carboxypeptidase 2 n=1 Tax=Paraglaciecola polaris LMG 21857 TaxID=1129793 RepID=K6ZRU9_9ALTE|nr:amidohydrolase [Paraglaciecola polaris]GAC31568.1 thermostable carboxypeptidase 2 [Paraglaciecola polaris LMG 21857]|tara:strand:- start:45486 stop:46808 length:1323 start_codon:yes stop_codon:yes gene_type:complete
MKLRRVYTAIAAIPFALSMTASADSISDKVNADMPKLMVLYKDLHAHPELSGFEVNTAAKLAKRVKALGFDVTENVGGTGVVAVLKNGPGPVLMIRADMDGLPVIEQTGLDFASKVRATTEDGIESGVMHACGHDTHMTSWVGTAQALTAMKDKWSGTLVMILQPAEERGKGARDMLADGLYERFPKPDFALAFHDAASLPAGTIGYTPGFALANVDSVDVIVKGQGGHGAYPHTTKDPIVLASRIVGALQTLVSRETDPQDSAVVTVGSFHGGAKHNIISDQATLLLTVRSYSDETRQKLLDGIARIAKGEAIAAGIPEDLMPEVNIKDEYTPATFNTPEFTQKMAGLFTQRFGEKRVLETPAVMGGEDFGRFYRADKNIESLIFWVGGVRDDDWQNAKENGTSLPSLHSPYWAPKADSVISTATEALTAAALDIMAKK